MSRRSRTSRCEMLFAGEHAYGGDVAFHKHVCSELILVVEGHCQTDTQDRSFDSYRGDLLLLPAYEKHNQIDHGPVRSLYVGFDSDLLVVDQPKLMKLKHLQWIEQCLSMLVELHMQTLQTSADTPNRLLRTLLGEISSQTRKFKANTSGITDPRLMELLCWIQEHLEELITVEMMAEIAGVTASRLFQIFKDDLKQSPMQHVLSHRMIRAKQYLKDPYLSIKDISPLCGYLDVNLFVRTFRQHHGMPPGRWREKFGS